MKNNKITLRVEGSATTSCLGFPLKIVSSYGSIYGLATDESDAYRQIKAQKYVLSKRPAYH